MKILVCFALAFALSPDVLDASEPQRVVSLGGSLTETVFLLNAGRILVGVDTTSTFPAVATELPQAGYSRSLSTEGVLSLSPDLILMTDHAGPPGVVEQLKKSGIPMLMIEELYSPEGVANKIKAIADALGIRAEGQRQVGEFEARMETVEKIVDALPEVRVLFLFAAGGGAVSASGKMTAADEVLHLAGGINVMDSYQGYRPLNPEAAIAAAPEVIVTTERTLASVGGVGELLKLPGLRGTPAGKQARVVALEDSFLLNFGPRLPEAVEKLALGMRQGLEP